MTMDWKKAITDKVKEGTEAVSQTTDLLRKKFESSGLKSDVENMATDAKAFLDDKGVTEAASKMSSQVDEHFKTLSGQRLLEIVEERLSLQARYNDILATRLDEALTRITSLETEVNKGKKTKQSSK